MQDQQPRRSIPVGIIAGFSALVLATGTGVAWWTWKSHSETIVPKASEHAQPSDNGNSALSTDPAKSQKAQTAPLPATADKTLQVYWLKASDSKIQLAPSPVKLTTSAAPEDLLETAIKQLLAGPPNPDVSSTVPKGTQLLDFSVKSDGIHIDLSREFTAGGGSVSMEGRLAQVLYTATSLNPDASVWLSVEGKQLETLGGEGLVLEQPVTRKQFERDFPL
ncbi:MAG: GerMN domain-containing protein [Oscillatoriales cyanobacterium C42_A2020_001]|nr:GerMN domain-containing protein [Leptolyngbyaceae cyanobacterium C42_A2020_001]